MLGGACLYTDRISKANWVGSIMRDGSNCVIYNSAEQLIDKFLYLLSNPSEACSISYNAQESLQPFLRDTSTLQKLWTAGPPRDRVLCTSEERRLASLLIRHLHLYGLEEIIRCIEIFENVQEAHRRFWLLTVKIIKSQQSSGDGVYRENSILDIIETSVKLLPRCRVIRMPRHELGSPMNPKTLRLDLETDSGEIISHIQF
jgi:hypothetical protein